MKITVVFLILIFGADLYASADKCISTRAAFDIGSGSTKMKVAKVNTCLGKILKIYLEESGPIGYNEDLKKSSNNTFSNTIIDKGVQYLKMLKVKASKFNPDSYVGVATSAFRKSSNANIAIEKINDIGIDSRVVSQEDEALIGFYAALSKYNIKKDELVVWDIGGGSMQITAFNKGKMIIYKGKLASVGFKNDVISKVLKQDSKIISTPNPIGVKNSAKVLSMAKDHALKTVSNSIVKALANSKKIVGIGGVLYYSINGQVKGVDKEFTSDLVKSTFIKRTILKDKDIGGKYASTDVTNLALVAGFMEALKMKSVKVDSINLSDGVLIRK